MRNDLFGLFWNDTPPPKKEKKEKIVRTPPARTWEDPSYLPYMDEAYRMPVTLFTDARLWEAANAGDTLLVDLEIYPNYFLAAFTSTSTGEVVYVEADDTIAIDVNKLGWLLTNFKTVGFNSNSFDLPLIILALGGFDVASIKEAANAIILFGERGYDIVKRCGLRQPEAVNHVDLIEVCPLSASLKMYGGRLHAPRMQELPFKPETWLSYEQKLVVRWYCIGADLVTTGFVWAALAEQRNLRDKMTLEYGVDLRSKSDAQIAEAVIMRQLRAITGRRYQKPEVEVGKLVRYNAPKFLQYDTPLMQTVLQMVKDAAFTVHPNGTIPMPDNLLGLQIAIGQSTYRMGVGGLHSTEERQVVQEDDEYMLKDVDVTSYYPFIILNTRLFPKHLGIDFLFVYEAIVKRRLEAKARGDKQIAESLKITINGTFGKLSSPFSYLYSPDLGMHVTLTGQLSLLMLIERLELGGFTVVSGNTDGIVIKVRRKDEHHCDAIIKSWELDTGFETEETLYKALYSRDVNNYIAVKHDGTTKKKGVYANPWGDMATDKKAAIMRFHKNPANIICIEAAEAFLVKGTQPIETIRASRDITRFVTVRNVTGGGVKLWPQGNEYLGKSARWYYSTQAPGELVYARSGNKVPRSDGAKPLLNLPQEFPDDVDFEWYEKETLGMLGHLGAIQVDEAGVEAGELAE